MFELPTFCTIAELRTKCHQVEIENLGCFLRITEEVSVWMILDAGFEMTELIIIMHGSR